MVVLGARRRPWLGFGWFWFLGTLVPVIGLLKVGSQAWRTVTPTSPWSGFS